MKYRFDSNQVYPQCYTCNITKSWNYRNYKIFMDQKVWPEQEDIYRNDNEIVKINQWDYEDMITKWHIYNQCKKKKIWDELK